MAININVNGESINYPETGDTNWSDEATDFAVQTASAFGKLGLDIGTSVDIPGTLDVTGATTLDSTLTVAGTTTLNGTANLNGNTNLGNGSSDTIAVTGILNVDSGVLYVDPNNRVGINDTTPSEALDVTGNALISGTLGVTGNLIASIVKASGSGGLTIDSNGGTDVALFGAGGGAGTTLYGGLVGTTGNFADTTDATSSTDGALKTAGGVGIAKKLFVGTGILTGDGTVGAPGITFANDPNTGLYRIGADQIGISANGTQVGSISTSGLSSNVGIRPPMWAIVDQKATGTPGGTFTAGLPWRTRDLNTTIGTNDIPASSLAANQFTLPSGTYYITVKAPAYAAGLHKCKLYNITDSADTLIGSSWNANAGDVVSQASEISASFTISATKVFEIQHRCATTSTTNGFGVASGFSVPEIYTIVNLWKLA